MKLIRKLTKSQLRALGATFVVFGLAFGLHMSYLASAQTAPSTRVGLPDPALAGSAVRNLENDPANFSLANGIQLGPNTPAGTGTPGSANQPLPSFSGINAPVWVNENGPVHVADDLILHGLNDFRQGIVSSQAFTPPAPPAFAQTTPPASAPAPGSPLVIYDDIYVYGNSAQEPGNFFATGGVYVGGTISSPQPLNIGQAGNDHQIRGNVRVAGGNLAVSGDATVNGPITVGTPGNQSQITINGSLRVNGVDVTAGGTGGGTSGGGTPAAGRPSFFTNSGQSVVVNDSQWQTSTASCGNASDVMVLCTPDFQFAGGTPPTSSDVEWFSRIETSSGTPTCRVDARFGGRFTASDRFTVSAVASCYR
ncbi:hypothetical protein COV82_02110 [Candidatus Peregrinibacteria bacterium CG11_big_fil_rev_8_21_14_0_20_46_8]|nr:MAG: hypothetical protein COV82_02110 [Candidatus Peregrinibacteria bacterium CG11_big_fil_rev_8_21_14_0_20_46_8]